LKQKICEIEDSHADQRAAQLAFRIRINLVLVHGETNLQMNFIKKIREHYGFDCSVPLMGQEFEI
jgi:metallo-beta-lactamase family protein